MNIYYKFIGFVEIKEMFGLPMVMAMAKDVEIDDVQITEARGMAKSFVVAYVVRRVRTNTAYSSTTLWYNLSFTA